MAVVSDHDLWALIGSNRLRIDPPPKPQAVSPSAIDLTLGNSFTRFRHPGVAIRTEIDSRNLRAVMDAIAELGKPEQIGDGEPFRLAPDGFALAWTNERIGLPNFLCARVEGRSTLARLGLSIHQTAPTVHATFTNRLQLELRNAGPYTLALYPGTPVCQLIVETLSSPSVSTLQSVHQGT